MTTQSAISGQSFGTSTNIGNNKFSINPLSLAAGTTAYVINVQITRGAATSQTDWKQEVRVWYTTTMRTVTAANAPYTLGTTARYVDCKIGALAAPATTIISKDGSLEPKTGTYLHMWVDAPNTSVACTLDVDVVEVPS